MRQALFALLMLAAGATAAHEIRPIYLQLEETATGQVDVLVKLPVFRDVGIAAAYPVFAPGCAESARSPVREGRETATQTWRLDCGSTLAGQRVRIEGFSVLAPDALLRVRLAGGHESHYILSTAHPSVEIQPPGIAAPSGTSLAAYLPIGIRHILFGFDHLLFVLALMLVALRVRASASQLVGTVTAFTFAHSVTLALAVLRGISLPAATVETLIALSILMLAAELARSARTPDRMPTGLTFRKPWLVAFVFGLLHGFGFAGALQETGLPAGAQGWALLLFNSGVEIGQLLFIAAVFALYRLGRVAARLPMLMPLPRLSQVTTALTFFLGAVSAAWVLDRALLVFAS